MAKARRATVRNRAQIRGDLASVVDWLSDAARLLERRAQYEQQPDITDFSWSESSDEYTFTTVGEWTTSTGIRLHIRIASERHTDADEVNRGIADGYFIQRAKVYQHRRHRSGREDITESDHVTDFQRTRSNRTTVSSTVTACRTGMPWWEYLPLRLRERQMRALQMRLLTGACESALAATRPGLGTDNQ
jgi:hypothetical protein